MALVIETIRCRHKENKDLVITVLDLGASDEDYREPAFIYKYVGLNENWQVSLNHNFLDDYEMEEI